MMCRLISLGFVGFYFGLTDTHTYTRTHTRTRVLLRLRCLSGAFLGLFFFIYYITSSPSMYIIHLNLRLIAKSVIFMYIYLLYSSDSVNSQISIVSILYTQLPSSLDLLIGTSPRLTTTIPILRTSNTSESFRFWNVNTNRDERSLHCIRSDWNSYFILLLCPRIFFLQNLVAP